MTIKHRLLGVIAASMLIIVSVLTWQQASSRLNEIEDGLRRKVSTYSQLLGNQVMSAVAFSDRETARQVLEGLETDREVASVTLLGANDLELYTYGQPSQRRSGEVVPRANRVISETPVVSLEGPRGVLVIELSTAGAAAARSRVVEISLAAGAIALACALVMAWLIASGLARRLGAIGRVMTAVAGGDLEQPPVDDTRRDEIGVLASAFNTMVGQLKQLLARVRELARKEQDRLGALVAERTEALETRTREMRLVFDQVDQGLLVVDLDGSIAPDHSAVLEQWLGTMPASHHIVDLVRAFSPGRAEWFALTWRSLQGGLLPLDLAVAQLPATFEVSGRHLAWSYKPFELAGGNARILVVISDLTAERARARDEQRDRETVSLLSRALRDGTGFAESCAEIDRLVAAIERGDAGSLSFARDVHTLKGASGLLELGSLAEACEALETACADRDDAAIAEQRAAIVTRARTLAELAEPFLANLHRSAQVSDRDLGELESALARGATSDELAQLVESWRDERAVVRLERLAELARSLAARVGKTPIAVTVDCATDLRAPAHLAPLWTALAHAVRNAIDHGIETTEERERSGKPLIATLAFRAVTRGRDVAIEIGDDGRGIAWDRVADQATARGLPAATPADLETALFSDGLSTAAEVTELSGRGVGLSAVRAVATSLGARTQISSTPGVGTTLRVSWPRDVWQAAITAKAS